MFAPDNKINPVSKDTSVNSQDHVTERKAPTGDFRKVEEDVEQRGQGSDEQELGSQKGKKKVTTGTGASKDAQEEALPLLSPFQLARGFRDAADEQASTKDDIADALNAAQPKQKKTPHFHGYHEPTHLPSNTHKHEPHHTTTGPVQKSTSLEDADIRYGQIEQPDLASVAPIKPFFIENTTPLTDAPIQRPSTLPTLQVLIDQIVEKVYTLKQAGDTQTIVDLKGNFAGSRLIVTESETAVGQLNITIDNLTAANQALLETNRTRLLNDLIASGVHVQRFIASPVLESARLDVATEEGGQQNFQHGQQQDNNPRQGKRQNPNDNA